MNHYTYEVTFENGKKYIGVRSCKCPIEEDFYFGSSKLIPPELYATCKKEILATFNTRIEAQQDEINRHKELDVARNEMYYNGVNAKSTGFSPIGLTKEVSENVRKRSEAFRVYRGNNRTEAQKKADKELSRFKGISNLKKGNKGLSNPQVKPWYYITPDNEYIEVYDSIRNYLSTHTVFREWSPSKIYERISTKAHFPALRGVMKGYTFGYIFDKPNYLTQENILLAKAIASHTNITSPHKDKRNRDYSNVIKNITGKK